MANPSPAPARNFTLSTTRCSSACAGSGSAAGLDCAAASIERIPAKNTTAVRRRQRQSTAHRLHFAGPEREFGNWRTDMLETIAIILIVLWLLGVVSGYTMGNFIYVLLVVAIVLFLVRLVSGRRVV